MVKARSLPGARWAVAARLLDASQEVVVLRNCGTFTLPFRHIETKGMAGHRKLGNEELERMDVEGFRAARKTPVSVILDNVRSAHNVGAVFRTSDAFRIQKIWLCGITATPPHREIRKTALGATDSVDWEYAKDAVDVVARLQKEGVRCLAVEQAEGALSLQKFSPTPGEQLALVFGHEVDGVSQEVINACGEVLEIPQFGTKHSLNISVATGVVLWDALSKLGRAGEPG